jgi:hypothetical protein
MVLPIRQKSGYDLIDMQFRGERHQQPKLASTSCYPSCFWRPVSLWVEAEYYDYGRVTLRDTQCNRQRVVDFLTYCLANTATVTQGDNQYHDLPYDLTAFMAKETPELAAWLTNTTTSSDADHLWGQAVQAWDYIWEVASKYRLFGVTENDGNLRPVQFALMHRAAYDELVTQAEGQRYFDNPHMKMREVFDRALTKAKDRIGNKLPSEAHDRWYFNHAFMDELRYIGYFEGMSYPGEEGGMAVYLDAHLNGKINVESLYDQLKPWFEARYVTSGLEALNLKFLPMVYAGQDYANEIGRNYARFVRGTSAVINKARRQRYED